MEELESQIAKITLGNTKSSNSYAYVMAEKALVGDAELYMVAELPLFNPAAEESCERICLAIASSLKRSFKSSRTESNFENAINQINEELGKLASMGQTQWIDRLSCILAVKDGNGFDIATCGKVSAYLLRGGEFTDISTSQSQSHPLKTFENYASGKIRLGDLLLLSTTQLFNYLSMDRILSIIKSTNFLTAAQTIIELLKKTADPQVSFGIILNSQVLLGQAEEQEVDLENYVVQQAPTQINLLSKAVSYAKNAFTLDKNKRDPQVDLPQVSLTDRLKNFSGNTKEMFGKGKGLWQSAKNSASVVKNAASPSTFKQYSTVKKWLLGSALVLLIAVIANIFIANHLKKVHAVEAQVSAQLTSDQGLLINAQSSLMFKDYNDAASALAQVKNNLPNATTVPSSLKSQYDKVLSQYQSEQQATQKIVQVQPSNLGILASSSRMIKLPQYLAAQSGNALVSYNMQNGQVVDGALSLPVTALDSVYVSGNLAAVYDGTSLYVWDFSTGKLSTGFTLDVPNSANFGGLAYYPVNNRVYIADKSTGQIVSFLISKSGASKPIVSVSDQGISTATDLAIGIDGSIFVANQNGIIKYFGGNPATFSTPQLATPLSQNLKLYTQKTFQYLYILDSSNNRIVVVDKAGNLQETLESSQFTKLADLEVNETTKTVYILNDGSLLKFSLP